MSFTEIFHLKPQFSEFLILNSDQKLICEPPIINFSRLQSQLMMAAATDFAPLSLQIHSCSIFLRLLRGFYFLTLDFLLVTPVDMSDSLSEKSLILGPWNFNLLCLSNFRLFGVSQPKAAITGYFLYGFSVELISSSSRVCFGGGLEIALDRGSTETLAGFFGFSVRFFLDLQSVDLIDFLVESEGYFFGVGYLACIGDYFGVVNPNGCFLMFITSGVSNRAVLLVQNLLVYVEQAVCGYFGLEIVTSFFGEAFFIELGASFFNERSYLLAEFSDSVSLSLIFWIFL